LTNVKKKKKKNLELPKRILLLKGVHLRLLDEFLDASELRNLVNEGIIEKKCFVLSRKNNFEIFFAGTNNMHINWLKEFKKCCILHRFKYKYKPIKPISTSSTSSIFEALSLETDEVVVIKMFDKKKIVKNFAHLDNKHLKIFSSIENEINILKGLEQENTVQLKEAYEGKSLIHLVLENLKGGDLYQKIVDMKKTTFKETEIKILIRQLIAAIRSLHDREIMHRDIKLENIIFVKPNENEIKLADFGLSEFEKKKKLLFTKCGTPGYVAPEVLGNQKYTKKCDMFSLGVILYIL